MDFNLKQKEGIGLITFHGSLTETHAAQLREVLMTSWGKNYLNIINLQHVTEIDRICLQIFCSAYRISLITQKFMTLIGTPSLIMKPAADNSAFCHSVYHPDSTKSGSPLECAKTCLWHYKGGH